MAWSWLRRRADRPSVPAPAATQPPATAPVRPLDDWQELPAVQRTLKPLSPIAPLDVFTNGLAAHQNPSFLAPLGHRVDPDGPDGLVTGLTSVRPGSPVPYAASTALTVPAARKPGPAVQRHAITWSTTAQPAESSAVALADAALIGEAPVGEPARDPAAAGAITGEGEVVRPTPAAAPVGPATPVARAATTTPPAPIAPTEPGSAGPRPTTETTPAPTDVRGSSTEPEPVTTEVVTPQPPRSSAGDAPVAPLLGSPPDVAFTAAETGGAPGPSPAGSPERTTPLPVSRLAADSGVAQPTGQTTAIFQPSLSRRVAAERPTISSSTPVPSLQRQLSAVPERKPRTSVLPPPFTLELPVVARTGPEPTTGGLAVDPPTDIGPTLGGPTDIGATLGGPPDIASTTGEPTTGEPTGGGWLPTATPTSGPPLPPTSSPQPGSAGLSSSPDPPSADGEPATGPTAPETFGWEPPEPTAPLSGFAARIASLTHPTADAGPPPESGRSVPPPVQRLVGPGAPLHLPTRTQPSEGQAAAPPGASPGSPEPLMVPMEPLVAPTVGGKPPLVQRATQHTGDFDAEAFELPPAAVPPVAPTGGSAPRPRPALPVVARLATSDLPPASSRPGEASLGGTSLGTATAALVPHRPPLAVRSDLSSEVSTTPAVQRVSFTGPGAPTTGHRPDAPSPVQRTVVHEKPVTPQVARRSTAGALPVVPAVVAPGGIERDVEPIRLQRRLTSLPASPAAGPLGMPATGPASAFAIAQSSTAGPARSFAAMFATGSAEQPAGEADGHPGYTSVQLQTAAEPAAGGPPSGESTTVPAAEPTVQTAGGPAAAASDAGPGAAPTAGVAAAQLDEMARRLFEPLSARLRAELWLDRERAGLVTDVRH